MTTRIDKRFAALKQINRPSATSFQFGLATKRSHTRILADLR